MWAGVKTRVGAKMRAAIQMAKQTALQTALAARRAEVAGEVPAKNAGDGARGEARPGAPAEMQSEVWMQAQMEARGAAAAGGRQETASLIRLEKEFFAYRERIYPWLYATGILLGELLVVMNARAGVLMHLLVLGALLAQAAYLHGKRGEAGGAAAAVGAVTGVDKATGAAAATSAVESAAAAEVSGGAAAVRATPDGMPSGGVTSGGAALREAAARFYLTLTLAPLIRILSLSLPLAVFPLMYWYAVVSLPLLVGAAVVAALNGYGRKDLGLTLGWRPNRKAAPVLSRGIPGRDRGREHDLNVRPNRVQGLVPGLPPGRECSLEVSADPVENENPRQGRMGGGLPVQLLIGLAGLPLGLAEYFILHPRPLVTTPDPAAIWLPALILLVCTGFTEELIFRGIVQKAAVDLLGWRPALVLVSFIFAALHITHLSALDVFFVFGVAAFFAATVYRTGSLFGVTLAHGLTNTTMYLIWPFVF